MSDRLLKRGDVWHATYYDERGRRRRVSTKCQDRDAALAFIQRVEREVSGAAPVACVIPEDLASDKVYFVRAGTSGPIKVGTATDIAERMCRLQTGNHAELRLLAWIPGGHALERELHKLFAEFSIAGEWFRPDPRLMHHLDALSAVLRGSLPKARRKTSRARRAAR